MDCAALHGRETAGRAAAHRGIPSGSARNAIGLRWWHHGCADRLPHSGLSVQIDFPYVVRDVLLRFLLTGCWIWPQWEAADRNYFSWFVKNKKIKKKNYQYHCSFFILCYFESNLSFLHIQGRNDWNKSNFLCYIASREIEIGSWEYLLFTYYSHHYFYWDKYSLLHRLTGCFVLPPLGGPHSSQSLLLQRAVCEAATKQTHPIPTCKLPCRRGSTGCRAWQAHEDALRWDAGSCQAACCWYCPQVWL